MFLEDLENRHPNVAALDGNPPTPESILRLAAPPALRRIEKARNAVWALLELLAGWHFLVKTCLRMAASKEKMSRWLASSAQASLDYSRQRYIRQISELYDAKMDLRLFQHEREEVYSWMPDGTRRRSLVETRGWDPETAEVYRSAWEEKLVPFLSVLWALKVRLRTDPFSVLDLGLQEAPMAGEARKPVWNKERGELSLDGEVIRQVARRNLGTNIVMVLDAFEARGWPEKIDDPVEPGDTQKLNETVKSLNKGLRVCSKSPMRPVLACGL